jgi:AAA+ ATPase superfamily predicted ATPase
LSEETFIGRSGELASLEKRYKASRGQLVLVYGRRRIGKSFLLERFSAGKPTVFYQATQQAERQELEGFQEALVPLAEEAGLPGFGFSNWEAALDFLTARKAWRGSRLLVILDEFPYLADSTPSLPSIIQRWWDRGGRTSKVMLVLCGSAQAFMEQLEGPAAPLHQRFTAKIHVGPLSFREAGEFTPKLEPQDKARVFGILGGTPLYLRQWDEAQSISENLMMLFGDPASQLLDSAELVLSTDIRDARAPYRALQSIALGATKYNDIQQKAKLSNDRVLQRLVELQLIEKRIPATEHPDKSRRSLYAIADPYFRFYFRYIALHRGAIGRGLGARVIERIILPDLDNYVGFSFEDQARAFARDLVRRGELPGDDVGSWWSTDGQHQIDIVGTSDFKPSFIGSVKWRRDPLGESVLRDLEDDARELGVRADVPRLLIGRSGATPKMLEREGLRSYSVADMYA